MLAPTSMGKRIVAQMDTLVRCLGSIAFYQMAVNQKPEVAELLVKEVHRLRYGVAL